MKNYIALHISSKTNTRNLINAPNVHKWASSTQEQSYYIRSAARGRTFYHHSCKWTSNSSQGAWDVDNYKHKLVLPPPRDTYNQSHKIYYCCRSSTHYAHQGEAAKDKICHSCGKTGHPSKMSVQTLKTWIYYIH